MRKNWLKLSKADWYLNGGFANTRLFRKANSRGVWSYYMLCS